MNRQDYVDDADWDRFLDFSKNLETPCLIINTPIVQKKFTELQDLFPFAKIYFAVKACPSVEILTLLAGLGSNFDIASIYELDKVLSLGISPDRLSCGNTIKKAKDIKYFYEKGVRLFVTDSKADLQHLAEFAPGAKIFVRILVESGDTADWPLSRKFGCHPDMAYNLLVEAKKLGLNPYGISFHVGSQQRDIGQWDEAIAKSRYLFTALEEEENIRLSMINMGGGFPANYLQSANPMTDYAGEITRYLQEDFGDDLPEIILEPGRSIVADAGILISEVVLISRKNNTALQRWVYTDVGKFNGLIETMGESIKYPLMSLQKDQRYEDSGKSGEVILAGPTCDSMDIMYEKHKYQLPLSLAIGDRLYWFSTGAYTSSYCSVEFNGFPPMKTYFLT